MKNYENELYEKIAEVVSFVCRNPLVFVSETDIHALMMSSLMEIDCLNPFKELYKTDVTIGKNNKGDVSPDRYRTMLVHKEYGHNEMRWGRSDIVIFDDKEIENINDPINLKNKKEYLTPKYIFEFGTEKSAGSVNAYKKHLENDFEKLSHCSGEGFLIHVHRNYIRSKRDSENRSKNEKKFDQYENVTSRVWKKYEKNTKLKILIFFVQIGVPDYYTVSKVQMFDQFLKSRKKIRLEDIENKIKLLLKKKK